MPVMAKIDLYLLEKKINLTELQQASLEKIMMMLFVSPKVFLNVRLILHGNSIYGDCFSNYMTAGLKGILHQMRHICKIKVKPNINISSLPKTFQQPMH